MFLLTLTWLVSAFARATREERQKIVVAYDNMCHLNGLRVAQEPLPLPGDLKYLWADVTKVIDELHLKNHKDRTCHEKYSFTTIKKDNPHFNTMACEQTFAWLSRFKKILCAMHKAHFHFFLHRIVKRRNSYIEYCYLNNRRALLPKV